MGLLEEFPTWTSTGRMKSGFSDFSRNSNPMEKSDAEKEIKAVKAFQAHVDYKLMLYRRISIEFWASYDDALHELLDKVPHVKDLPEFDTLFSEFQKSTIVLELQKNDKAELTDANKMSADPLLLKELQLDLQCAQEKLLMITCGLLDLLELKSSARLLLVDLEQDLDYFASGERDKRKRGGEGYAA